MKVPSDAFGKEHRDEVRKEMEEFTKKINDAYEKDIIHLDEQRKDALLMKLRRKK